MPLIQSKRATELGLYNTNDLLYLTIVKYLHGDKLRSCKGMTFDQFDYAWLMCERDGVFHFFCTEREKEFVVVARRKNEKI